jgi:hypothetical protein
MLVNHSNAGETSILVAYVNFAVGSAIAQRLMDSSVVALAAAPAASRALANGHYDIVVLCPYLVAAERARVLAACAEVPDPPAIVEVVDTPGEPATARPVDPAHAPDPRVGAVVSALVPVAA